MASKSPYPESGSSPAVDLRATKSILILDFRIFDLERSDRAEAICNRDRFAIRQPDEGVYIMYRTNYSVALRCIGQVLQQQNIEVFEVKIDGGEFRLQCQDPNPPYTGIVRFNYSVDNIKILDREGQARAGRSRAEIRFDSIPEVLRAIGDYLDSKQAQLRRLSSTGFFDQQDLEVEYQTRNVDIVSETLAMSFVRETAVRMYKRRSRISSPISMITRDRPL